MRPADIDLAALLPPGASIVCGAGPGEPRTLTAALVEQRHRLGVPRVYLGLTLSGTFDPEHAGAMAFTGMGGLGGNARLHRAGTLDVLPSHMSTLVRAFGSGAFPVDAVFAQVAPPDATGTVNLGPVAGFLVPALAAARVRIAEVNPRLPVTHGDTGYPVSSFDHVVHADYPLPEVSRRPPDDVMLRLAGHVAELVPDRAVLQAGIGSVLDAVVGALRPCRDLGVHSGLFTDALRELQECGTVTGAAKPVDRGVSVATMVLGGAELYDFVHRNPAVAIRSAAYTHDARVLAGFDRLVAVNSAVEVDLTGQVGAEVAGGTHVGAVGGLVDFSRAAMASPHGRSIVALPSTARGGTLSRIVPRLAGPVTLARSDVDTVVTEYGVAELAAAPLAERARRLIRLAHPAFRDELSRYRRSEPIS